MKKLRDKLRERQGKKQSSFVNSEIVLSYAFGGLVMIMLVLVLMNLVDRI